MNMNSPPSVAWLSQLEGARSVAELVRILRDYLASLGSSERRHLPEGCSPERIESAADIQEWAVAIAQADLRSTGSQAESGALHHAAVVFAAAGARLPRLHE